MAVYAEATADRWCRLAIEGRVSENLFVNVFNFIKTSNTGLVLADMDLLIDSFINGPMTAYRALRFTGFTIQRLVARNVRSGELALAAERTVNLAGTGFGNDATAYQVAAVISWRSGIPGRRFRGRNYHGPLSEDLVANGSLSAEAITRCNTFVTSMLTNYIEGIGTSAFTMGVISDPSKTLTATPLHMPGSPDYQSPLFCSTTIGKVDPVVGIIRKRRKGSGS
jgi:hypothetical protein